ncbi:MAG: UDP-N-acetyl-D-galactosamine dehydrogenase [Candidatus Peregrinibacteria bacterium Greene0416_19]|nr:MAG: UDP-N-acetyl-D-galactosamine dehydrogenase [Candidatus Peregrinibacteria bacterium Greene0416_19]
MNPGYNSLRMKETICIVGLGYVGLPLAHAFAKAGFPTIGYDIAESRITELKSGHDRTGEVADADVKKVSIEFSTDASVMAKADVIVLAIPTPVDEANKPDLTLVKNASHMVGKHLKKGAIVVYESTVYPGVTEEICGPILEKESGMTCGTDFFLGYSPERINPGDREHTIDKVVKVVVGQDENTTETLTRIYGTVVTAGIHRAPSIKVAEMAKAIENAQRDLNIAFMNEIAMLCGRIGIATRDVLAAARTKWNFLPFQPGLVGGHCIGVDPYYLVEKARQLKMETHVITAGRAINDGMAEFVALQVIDALAVPRSEAKILVLGLTFKENVPDTRNSKAHQVARALTAAGCHVRMHDPFVTTQEIVKLGMTPGTLDEGPYDAVVLLVTHREYLTNDTDPLIRATKKGGLIYDLKSVLDAGKIIESGRKYAAL